MIHSGSRNIGKKIGDYFNEVASKLNKSWYSKSDIPFLPTDTDEGQSYLMWMNFALEFAYLNRKVMMDYIKKDLQHEFPSIKFLTSSAFEDHKIESEMINVHHNFAALENHLGKNLWVHRKGATQAYKDQLGIIPGSMGSKSFITIGKGESLSLKSSSHGAGRKMGRKEFCRQMEGKYQEIEASLEGVVHSDFGKVQYGKGKGLRDVSEAPQAYKNIESVINNELDLIDPVITLTPMISVKG